MRFQNEAVTTFKLDSYKELIPEELFTRLRTGEYYAAAAIAEDGQTFGVYVTDIIDGWIRIIWLGFSDPDISTAEKALFIRYCIRREKKRESLPRSPVMMPGRMQGRHIYWQAWRSER